MRHLIIILSVLLVSLNAQASIDWGAQVTIETRHYLLDREVHPINHSETFEGTFYFEYKNEKNFEVHINPRLVLDAANTDRNRYLPNEAYLTVYGKLGELNAGLMTKSWGISPLYQPTDVLNRSDLEFAFYEAPPLGELMIEYKKSFSDLFKLSTYLLPLFQKTPLPELNTRYNIEGRAGFVPYSLNDDIIHPPLSKQWGAGFDLEYQKSPLTVHLYYFHGPERTPGFVLRFDNLGALRLKPFYYTVDMIGTSLEATVKNFVFRLEATFKTTVLNNDVMHSVAFEDDNALPESYFQYVPGIEYTWKQIFGTADLTLIGSYYGDTEGTSLRNFRPFQNDLFIGAKLNINDSHQNQIELGIAKDLGNAELAALIQWQMRIYRELKVSVGALYMHQSDGLRTPISYFDNNTQVYSKLSYSF